MTSTTYVGPPTTSLVDASLHADTVVIGSRGRRALRGFLLGATSLEVAAHAAGPVVVVRENALPDASSRKVVVGVDGSPRSTEAVAYAFAYASAHGLDLTVLHAFQVEYVSGVISKLSAEESNARLAQEELALTSETVAGWQEKYPDVHVHTVTHARPPGRRPRERLENGEPAGHRGPPARPHRRRTTRRGRPRGPARRALPRRRGARPAGLWRPASVTQLPTRPSPSVDGR